jgi:hypothetical protein
LCRSFAIWGPVAAFTLAAGLGGCQNDPITPRAADVPEPTDTRTPAQLIVALAGDPGANPDARRAAMLRIVESSAAGEAVYLDFYRATLTDDRTDATVAAVCALALAEHGEPEDVRYLTPLLERGEPFGRWQAAVALQRLHHPDAIDPLMRALRLDEDADVRAAAAVALGQYPRRPVYDTLITALDDPDSGVARAARQSLTLLTGHDGSDDPRDWLDHADDRSHALFQPQPYTFRPYPPSRGLWGVVFFWLERDAQPQQPRGYEPPAG